MAFIISTSEPSLLYPKLMLLSFIHDPLLKTNACKDVRISRDCGLVAHRLCLRLGFVDVASVTMLCHILVTRLATPHARPWP